MDNIELSYHAARWSSAWHLPDTRYPPQCATGDDGVEDAARVQAIHSCLHGWKHVEYTTNGRSIQTLGIRYVAGIITVSLQSLLDSDQPGRESHDQVT